MTNLSKICGSADSGKRVSNNRSGSSWVNRTSSTGGGHATYPYPIGLISRPRFADHARVLGDGLRQPIRHQLANRDVVNHTSKTCPYRDPHLLEPVGVADIVDNTRPLISHPSQRPVNRPHDVGNAQIVGVKTENVPTLGTSLLLRTIPARRRSDRMFSRNLIGIACASAI